MTDVLVQASPPAELLARRASDPYPYFRWLREHAPVFAERKRDGRLIWHISRHDDVRALLGDERLSKNPDAVPGYRPGPEGLNKHLVHADPPEHTRLRRLVSTAFLPRRIAALEPFIQRTAEDLLDRLDPDTGIDLIGEFALLLTFTLICTILGVPEQLNTPATRTLLTNTVVPTAGRRTDDRLRAFLAELIAHKRHQRTGELDLLGALVGAREQLSEEELAGTAYLLLLVGHDTTVNLIGNGMLALLRHPGQLQALRADPALIGTGLEELLRYDSPVRDATFRVAAQPIRLHDRLIQPDDIVSLLIGSANRDPARFPDPDRLNLTRDPNDHLTFGRGPHFCIGAALSRMEGALAVNLVLHKLGEIRLAAPEHELRWRPFRVMRGLESLPVVRR
ncbi:MULTISPECIES: cytochrome P450 [unclassified Crossiella]|uniref:cytochrome P450 family protein n=1 Tax=unclassified Crossiella TaxID=2620835 RepID=UPI001FFE919A|nr:MULTISPECIES: cytochrome P450 [unclassified Crossiella]MCK2238747.1 cytochrome P450 [Crossiella sp. S99.2]MCK2251683.1 cytochrome P450 [Crossiella sp. S99.1]